MALLILALLQRIFLMSSLMLLLVWLIFFMVLIKLLPILGTISGKTVKRSEERFSRNAETDIVCRLLLEKKKQATHAFNRRRNDVKPSLQDALRTHKSYKDRAVASAYQPRDRK